MESNKLTGKDLKEIGFPEGKALGVALEVMERGFSKKSKFEKLSILRELIKEPAAYLADLGLKKIAENLYKKSRISLA